MNKTYVTQDIYTLILYHKACTTVEHFSKYRLKDSKTYYWVTMYGLSAKIGLLNIEYDVVVEGSSIGFYE